MNQSLQFVPVDLHIHSSQLIELNVEYLNWVVKRIDDYYNMDLSDEMGISVREYVIHNFETLCSVALRQGIFYLIKFHNRIWE